MTFLRSLIVTSVLTTAGCGYWGRRPVEHPVPIDRTAPVWIWSHTSVTKWHAVVVSGDSVVGIPYRMSVKCDSCRRSLPRNQVDSMKVGYRTTGQTTLLATGVFVGIVFVELGCRVFAPNDPQC